MQYTYYTTFIVFAAKIVVSTKQMGKCQLSDLKFETQSPVLSNSLVLKSCSSLISPPCKHVEDSHPSLENNCSVILAPMWKRWPWKCLGFLSWLILLQVSRVLWLELWRALYFPFCTFRLLLWPVRFLIIWCSFACTLPCALTLTRCFEQTEIFLTW